jgi:large conductance mechanosensitive channel
MPAAPASNQLEGSMLKEFRDFAMRGNLVDMAVGIIMGTAFGSLINSMVNDIIMPIVGRITGGVDFSNYYLNLSGQKFDTLKAAKEAGAAVSYGIFINLVINFIIIAFVMFLLIKAMNKTRKQAPPAEPPAPPRSEVLLAEIRDLLKKPA